MKSHLAAALFFGFVLASVPAADERAADERLVFQPWAPWSRRTYIEGDVAVVCGIDPTLPARIATWRSHGYLRSPGMAHATKPDLRLSAWGMPPGQEGQLDELRVWSVKTSSTK